METRHSRGDLTTAEWAIIKSLLRSEQGVWDTLLEALLDLV